MDVSMMKARHHISFVYIVTLHNQLLGIEDSTIRLHETYIHKKGAVGHVVVQPCSSACSSWVNESRHEEDCSPCYSDSSVTYSLSCSAFNALYSYGFLSIRPC